MQRNYSHTTFNNQLDERPKKERLVKLIQDAVRIRGLAVKDFQAVVPTITRHTVSEIRNGNIAACSPDRLR